MTRTPEVGARARPVLLTVDDDPGVSRAVASDLRRHYGERFRVVRASSGEEALEALPELTLRGDQRGFVLTGPELLVDGERPPGWRLQRDPFFLESSVPGVFVAGDVRSRSVERVASAVGEDAMAVTLVHRYLEER
jgi:thioredoxin reductase